MLIVAGAAVLATTCRATPTAYVVVDAARPAPQATPPILAAALGDSVVDARFRHVSFHIWSGVVLALDDLTGRMHSTRADRVVSFDDKTSFVLAIDTGVVGLGVDDLARLMNTYVFAYRGARLKGSRSRRRAIVSCSAACCTRSWTSPSRWWRRSAPPPRGRSGCTRCR